MYYIGKIDKRKLGQYGKIIVTEDVVLTDERNLHIYEKHKKDYEIIIHNIEQAILEPKEILIDMKNNDTVFFIKKLNKNNLNVVVKLNTINDDKHPKNSIMTAWIIRDKNLQKLRKANEIIYKSE